MKPGYEALQERLWQLVAATDAKLSDGAEASAARLVALLQAEGWQLGADAQAEIAAYFQEVDGVLRQGIRAAIPLGSPAPMGDAVVARLAEQAFTQTWENGNNLSSALWNLQQETRAGFGRILGDAARQGRSANTLIYDLQRQIETGGQTFKLAHTAYEDWATMLAESGRALAKTPETRALWVRQAREIRAYLDTLSENGTKQAALHAYKKIVQAINAGRDDLLADAIRWWQYDKQLYFLKRISRTELANAQHNAVIESAIDDQDIIGFQWRLSSSHPRPDICDYYANIDMGLGRGVFTKETVPRRKPHPLCMCPITPRVTKIKQAGAHNYVEFVHSLPADKLGDLLPPWARTATRQGVDLADLLRPDGMGLISKAEAVGRFGADRVQ